MMNRNIRFRVWHKNKEKWLHNEKVCNLNFEYTSDNWLGDYQVTMENRCSCGLDCAYDYYSPYELELCQNTGVKDKDGKEIFEGDIIKCANQKGVVRFKNGSFVAKLPVIEGTGQKRNILLSTLSDVKIIGNVFENSELLDEKG